MTPPGAGPGSTQTTSWPALVRKCAAARPEIPPPTTAMRLRRAYSQSRPPLCAGDVGGQIGQGVDEGRVAADGAGAGEVGDAALLGALAVEDVDLLQRLDVLAGEGDGDDDDGALSVGGQRLQRVFGVGSQPFLAAAAALEGP